MNVRWSSPNTRVEDACVWHATYLRLPARVIIVIGESVHVACARGARAVGARSAARSPRARARAPWRWRVAAAPRRSARVRRGTDGPSAHRSHLPARPRPHRLSPVHVAARPSYLLHDSQRFPQNCHFCNLLFTDYYGTKRLVTTIRKYYK